MTVTQQAMNERIPPATVVSLLPVSQAVRKIQTFKQVRRRDAPYGTARIVHRGVV